MTPLLVSRKEAAAALNISVWVLDRYIASGLIPKFDLPSTAHPGEDNRRVLIAVSDLEAFVAAHREVAR